MIVANFVTIPISWVVDNENVTDVVPVADFRNFQFSSWLMLLFRVLYFWGNACIYGCEALIYIVSQRFMALIDCFK